MPPRLDRRGGWRGADARPSLILASSPPTADWMVIAWSCASLAAVARIRQDGGGEELIEGVRAGLQQRSHVFGPAAGQVHVPASAGIPPNASSTLAAACAAAYSALVDPRVQPPYSGGQSRLGCAQRSLLGHEVAGAGDTGRAQCQHLPGELLLACCHRQLGRALQPAGGTIHLRLGPLAGGRHFGDGARWSRRNSSSSWA